jgi:cyclopropane fatty-acyl-phospholipid synthase-like methyltransferase
MNESPRRAEANPEEFYEAFWRSARWGGVEPNRDEQSRLSAVTGMLDGCDLGPRPRILDLGCGRGWLTRALSAYGDVIGTDVVASSVDRARELFPDLRFEQTDIRGLIDSRGPGSFDVVVSSEVLEHVEDEEKHAFLGGIHRLLEPGGYAILTTPRGELWEHWRRSRDWKQPVEEWISEDELDRMATGIGFRVEARTRAHVYGISPMARLFLSRPFRFLTRLAPSFEGTSYPWRIYQVVLLRRSPQGAGAT